MSDIITTKPVLSVAVDESNPSPVPTGDGRTKYNDYSERIAELKQVQKLRQDRRQLSGSENELARLRFDLLQLANAIDLWEQAEYIPAVMTQFGTHLAKEFRIPLPPKIEGMWNRSMRVQGKNYVVKTDKPFEIAALRDVVRRNQIEGMHEMKPGLSPAINPQGVLFMWLEPEQFIQWQQTGSGRSY